MTVAARLVSEALGTASGVEVGVYKHFLRGGEDEPLLDGCIVIGEGGSHNLHLLNHPILIADLFSRTPDDHR
jgi:hypothetical protein